MGNIFSKNEAFLLETSKLKRKHIPISDAPTTRYGPYSQAVKCSKCGHVVITTARYRQPFLCLWYIMVPLVMAFTFGLGSCLIATYLAPTRILPVKHECPICIEIIGRSQKHYEDN